MSRTCPGHFQLRAQALIVPHRKKFGSLILVGQLVATFLIASAFFLSAAAVEGDAVSDVDVASLVVVVSFVEVDADIDVDSVENGCVDDVFCVGLVCGVDGSVETFDINRSLPGGTT
jgi:hypothetical protein